MDFYEFLNLRFIKYFDEAHDINHTLNVTYHCYMSIKDYDLDNYIKDAIILAGACHEINDHKFVPESDYLDLNNLLIRFYPDIDRRIPSLVIEMVDLVSCSKNGDSYVVPTWKLIPRYCDRIEAIGNIGIKRCFQYSKTINRPLYNKDTPEVYNLEDIQKIATKERYKKYNEGNSKNTTTIDHFYDKIVHINVPDWIENDYLINISKERYNQVIEFLTDFWREHNPR